MLTKNVSAYLYSVDALNNRYSIGEIKNAAATLTNEIDCAPSCVLTGELKPVKESDDFNRGYKIGKDVGSFYDYILGRHPMASGIEKVIFNPPATIVIWKDGSKTVVKCKEGDQFDEWAGLSLCICKKILGKDFHRFFRKYCEEDA